jgi:catechol 2,3-dioxygenase-like lactoylglutathione lyase family enzyme
MSVIRAHHISELLAAKSHLDRATFSHVGILVADLDAAVKTYSGLLGLSFNGPKTVHVPRFVEPGRDGPIDVRVAFSKQGPPHYELMEKTGNGFYGTEHPDGFNHVGVWVEDADAAMREADRKGLRRQAVQYDEEGQILVAFFYPDGLQGLRLELVPERNRERFKA